MRRRVVIHWGMSSFFGWGVYGLNLALNWSADPDIEPLCSFPIDERQVVVDALKRRQLEPFVAASNRLRADLERYAGGEASTNVPVLAALGNGFAVSPAAGNVRFTGKPTVGVVFFEVPQLDADAVRNAKSLPLIVAGSTWNARILAEYGVTSVRTVIQGIDPTVFHPAPRAGILGDRFKVFSGGKLELRKGQDLVVAAFRIFAERHPDALLVTAWHSPWPQFARTLDQSRRAAPVVFAGDKVDVPAWAAANGIASHQVLDLGAVPNAFMPPILREMDVALFPNRSEGGTNLVAMECMACGVPTILSANTGHLDLLEDGNCYRLDRQQPVGGSGAAVGGTPGWGESDVEEILDALERAYSDREDARKRASLGAATLSRLTWSATADAMKDIVVGL